MKRGFLNSPRSKRAIEEAYAPAPPPGSEVRRQEKRASVGGGKSVPARDAMEVDTPMTAVEKVYVLPLVALIRGSNGGVGLDVLMNAPSLRALRMRWLLTSKRCTFFSNACMYCWSFLRRWCRYADGQVVAVRVKRSTGEEEKASANQKGYVVSLTDSDVRSSYTFVTVPRLEASQRRIQKEKERQRPSTRKTICT